MEYPGQEKYIGNYDPRDHKPNHGWQISASYKPPYQIGISFARNLQGLIVYGIIGETNVRNKLLNVIKLFLMGYLPLAFLYTLFCMLPQWLLDFRFEALNSFVYAPITGMSLLMEILLIPIFSPMIAGWEQLEAGKSDEVWMYAKFGAVIMVFAVIVLVVARWLYEWLDRKCPNFYKDYSMRENSPEFWEQLREKDAKYIKALEIYKDQQLERLRRGE